MKKTEFRFIEIKEISEDGTFEGILSPYGNVDEGGDVVERGAFVKTIKEKGPTRPLLWQHRTDTPIGEIELEDRKDGLWCRGKLLLELEAAKTAYVLIKNRIVKGLSIGFESIKDSIEGGVRHLKEIKLWEGSLVTFPMNELAQVTRVKARAGEKGDFNEELDKIQTLNSFSDMQMALNDALRSLLWTSEMEKDEKVAACNTILSQFSEAFSNFFPDYLDALAEMWGPMENWSKDKFELKSGATFSLSNKTAIRSNCEQLKSVHDALLALIPEEAAENTSAEKAATTQPQLSEPEIENHSAFDSLLIQAKESYQWKTPNSN